MKNVSWFHEFKIIRLVWGINSRNIIFCQKLTWSQVANKMRLTWPHRSRIDPGLYVYTPIASCCDEQHARFFPRSSSSIGGETAPGRGGLCRPSSPVCCGRMQNDCRRGLTHIRSESIPEGRSRSRSHLETHRLGSPACKCQPFEVDPAASRYFCEQVASTLTNTYPYNPINLTLAAAF